MIVKSHNGQAIGVNNVTDINCPHCKKDIILNTETYIVTPKEWKKTMVRVKA